MEPGIAKGGRNFDKVCDKGIDKVWKERKPLARRRDAARFSVPLAGKCYGKIL